MKPRSCKYFAKKKWKNGKLTASEIWSLFAQMGIKLLTITDTGLPEEPPGNKISFNDKVSMDDLNRCYSSQEIKQLEERNA